MGHGIGWHPVERSMHRGHPGPHRSEHLGQQLVEPDAVANALTAGVDFAQTVQTVSGEVVEVASDDGVDAPGDALAEATAAGFEAAGLDD